VVTANDYSIDFIENGSAAWTALNKELTSQDRNLSALSVDEIRTTYNQEYVSTHGDVILWVDKLSVEYKASAYLMTGERATSHSALLIYH
jgi:hypothetical protein